jgi:3-methyladenine DNA glycosylase AlkC
VLHPDTESPLGASQLDEGLRGWALVPVGSYVARHGMDCPDASLDFLRQMTMRFTAEFAVRPFFRDHTGLTLDHAARWARDGNAHVRRLASEGSRPRLPWGLRLACFVDDPAPLLPILQTLRDDPSEDVRRSVANNLNDIAKDHANLVAKLAADWMRGAPASRKKLLKHACRSLIKAGHPGALRVFGFAPPAGVSASLSVAPDRVELGQPIALRLVLTLIGSAALPVLIDFALHFRKADGRLSPKVFKWTETVLRPGAPLVLEKRVPLRDVTTRRHYSGEQAVSVQVNGRELCDCRFELTLPG